jgi:hypothetical protein
MKKSCLLLLCLTPVTGQTQETPPVNRWKAAPMVVPEVVAKATVLNRKVIKGGGQGGGDLILERIAAPVFPKPAPAQEVVKTPPTPEEMEALAARRAAEPNELLLFSPTVVVFENNLSLVKWWSADAITGYQEFSAWVRLDLSSINACGDLTVGRRRYCMMSMMYHAADRSAGKIKAPALTDFKEDSDILLTKGNPANTAALEPLKALLAKYDTERGLIESTAAAIKADQDARRDYEAKYPSPPENTVIRYWTSGD